MRRMGKTMETLFSWTSLIIIVHAMLIVGVIARVIMMRLAVGTALAWMILIFFLPFAGALIYLVLGEKRLGRKRTRRAASLWERYSRWLRELPRLVPDERSGLSPEAAAVSRLPEGVLGTPVLPGNRLEIMDAAEPILRSISAHAGGNSRRGLPGAAGCHGQQPLFKKPMDTTAQGERGGNRRGPGSESVANADCQI
jgi:hypothetical protein